METVVVYALSFMFYSIGVSVFLGVMGYLYEVFMTYRTPDDDEDAGLEPEKE